MNKILLASAALLTTGMAWAQQPAESRLTAPIAAAQDAAALTIAPKGEVTRTETLKNGAVVNHVKGQDGLVRKVMKSNPYSLSITPKKQRAAYRLEANPTFFEDFEAYDGETEDWIPDGWQDVSKAEPANTGAELTWKGTAETIFTPVYDGDAAMLIENDLFGMTAQDEWLITPSITPATGDYLNFYLSYSPGWTTVDIMTYPDCVFNQRNNVLEVLVSEDDGANWTKLWDSAEDAALYTDDEKWESMTIYSYPYVPIVIDLNAYAGKPVKVAFRNLGKDGNYIVIDNVGVGKVTPEAAYEAGYGVFNVGLSYDNYSLSGSDGNDAIIGLAPYKTPVSWTNAGGCATSYLWQYPDPENNDQSFTSPKRSLVAGGYAGRFDAPVLTSYVGETASDPYTAYKDGVLYGGSYTSASGREFDACLYNVAASLSYSTRYFAYADGIDATWKSLTKQDLTFDGVGVVVQQPTVPYALSTVYARIISSEMSATTTLKATVYAVTGSGFEELASGTTTQDKLYTDGQSGIYTASFALTANTGGLPRPVTLTVDCPIFIQITAECAPTDVIAFIGTREAIGSPSSSYVCFKVTDSEGNVSDGQIASDALSFTDGTGYTNWLISFDATYNYLYTDDTAFAAHAEGGSKTFTVESSDPDVKDNVTVNYTEGEDTSWYTVAFGEYDATTQSIPMTVTVQPMPEGSAETDYRSSEFSIAITGTYTTFTVDQDAVSSVGSMVAADTKVAVTGGDFAVSSSKATAVEVYNVAGQKVAAASFSDKAVIPASNLAGGVYILKFNDNTVVKVIK